MSVHPISDQSLYVFDIGLNCNSHILNVCVWQYIWPHKCMYLSVQYSLPVAYIQLILCWSFSVVWFHRFLTCVRHLEWFKSTSPHSAMIRVMLISSSGGSADAQFLCLRRQCTYNSACASDFSAWKQCPLGSALVPNASFHTKEYTLALFQMAHFMCTW